LDLTGAADVPETHTLALVNRIAEQIEHRVFEDRFRGYELLNFYPDRCPIGGSQEGRIAFDNGRLVGASRKAIAFLGQDRLLLGASFDDLFAVEPAACFSDFPTLGAGPQRPPRSLAGYRGVRRECRSF
jgi:hypothetical protein